MEDNRHFMSGSHERCLTIFAVIVLCLVMKKKADTQCVHISKVNPNIHGNSEGCEKCEKIGSDWVHLRLCLT